MIKGGHFFIHTHLKGIVDCYHENIDHVQAMVTSPFPGYVGFAVKTKENLGEYSLTHEEARILSPSACKKRREEFLLGRAACNSALKQVGFASPPPVLKGPLNEPLWFKGYLGSITHTSHIAICAICPDSKAAGIGLDLEELEGDVSLETYRLVSAEEELQWIKANQAQSQLRFKRLFSAKEAAFKAFFPHAQEYLGFKDAAFSWGCEKNGFFGTLLRPIGNTFPNGYNFEVGSLIVDSFIFSFVLLPASCP